jgi:hydrogenase nickel incorporation protein HypA/HybF
MRQTECQTESESRPGVRARARAMRELSMAQALVDNASRHAAGRPVRKVEVSLGRLREVDPSMLCLAFDIVTNGTALDGAELQIGLLDGEELLIDALVLEPCAANPLAAV